MNATPITPAPIRRLLAKLKPVARGLVLPALAAILSASSASGIGVTEAIRQGLITASGKPVSGYSECQLQVTVQHAAAVEIDFSTCYFLQSNNSQRIGLSYERTTNAYLLTLSANTSYSLSFASRCLDSGRSSPSNGVEFTRIELIRPEFSAIIEALRSRATQSQVWAITNGSSPIAAAWRDVDPRVAPPPTTDLDLLGRMSVKWNGPKLTMKVERLVNLDAADSRRIRVALWATRSPHTGGWISQGHLAGSVTLNPLRGGYHFRKLSLKSPFNRPSTGTYYLTLTVEEEIEGRWVIADFENMIGTARF